MNMTLDYLLESTPSEKKETEWLSSKEVNSKTAETAIQDRLRYHLDSTQTRPVLLYSLNLANDMKALYINNPMTSASSVTQHDFFYKFTSSIFALLNEYIIGKKDIPDLAQELGESWSASSVIMLIEQHGAFRKLPVTGVSPDDETNTLNKIANLRASKHSTSYDSQSWIKREVIATQRLELINVFPEDLSG